MRHAGPGTSLIISYPARWGPWLAIASVLNSALSLAYYGWVLRKMYFEGETEKRVREPRTVMAVMIFSILFMVGLGVYPDPVISFVEFTAPAFPLPCREGIERSK